MGYRQREPESTQTRGGAVVTFEEVLTQTIAMLQRLGRVSYRALKRQFGLDDAFLDDLKYELTEVQQLAVDHDGTVLVWTGDASTAPAPMPTPAPSAAVSPPAMRQAREPLAYTPPYLAEKILTSRSALAGERKQVTVLFADLKGSMELLADRDPEEARQLLDPVLERMMAAVHRYEGTVNQVMGDGIMALFGAPIAHEDHAVRACYAALAMQEAIRRYSEEVRRVHGIEVQIRVGVNSGEVVVRAIGNDLHMDYSAIGQTTHLAARMEQLAPPGSIRLTADTLRLAEGWIQVTPLGPVPVKGLPAPVEVCELVGAGPARTHLQAFAARGLTPFVGRQAELTALHQALEQTEAGHGQVMAVIGEPGVGKTRLFHEFTHTSRTQGWLLLESSSTSYGKATPYLPVIDLLKAYFQLEDRDDGRRIREKLTGRLLTLDPALGPTLPAFLALLEVPVEEPAWPALDPAQRRQRTLDALKRLLLRESQVQPLLLVFENLHWIDAETQAFLDSLVESLPATRLLLLVNYRPEYQHGWGTKTSYTQLRLDPLSPASAEALLQSLLGDDTSLEPLKQRLIERTQGNPFFVEESICTLVETQGLVGEQGAYRMAMALPNIQVPATVQAVLAARIDRLPPEEKQLLQTAAVIGTEVPLALLHAMVETPEEALRLGLTRLQAAEFFYETRLFPDIEYTFKHALTQQVAYETLLQERRRALHARIVETLEALVRNRVVEVASGAKGLPAGRQDPDQVERLAHHALRGEVWAKALAYCRQAGEKAMAQSAYREAIGYFEQALRALQHLPEQRETREQAIDLRLTLRSALWPSRDFGRILAYLREAETLAAALDDPRRLAQVLLFLIEHFRSMGAYDQAIAAAQRALALATASGEVVLQAQANQRLGAAYQAQGDYRRAIDCLRQSVAGFDGVQRREHFGQVILPTVLSRAYLVWCHADVGTFAEGKVLGEEGFWIAEAVAHPASLMYGCWGIGLLFLRQGDLPRALPMLERAVGICREIDLPLFFPRMAAVLGAAYTLAGRLADAVPLLTQAREQTTTPEMVGFQALCSLPLGEAYLQAGRLEAAHALAEGVLALTRGHQERGNQAYALRLLGEIAARRDPPESAQAEAHYRQALALAEELGMRPLQAHCHLGLGTLYAAIGQREQARTVLSTAMALYRDMDMTFWLHQAEAVLAQVKA
jgi:class 3 adenylate cyclase/tetratricopeptide (TPR) repeat protein